MARVSTAGLGVGLAALMLVPTFACRLPDTLGLACTQDAQCIGPGTQHCNEQGVCVAGPAQSDDTSSDGESESESESESETGEEKMDMGIAPDMGPLCGADIGSCDKVDVLIVIDNSGSSTDDELVGLIAEEEIVQDLFEAMTEAPCDAQVGVTTTEEAPAFQPDACKLLGALNRGGASGEPDVTDCWDGGPPYFQTGGDPLQLLCALAPGDRYDDNERPMQAMLNALGPELAAEGACNEGFLREDAKLLIILVTDEDDDDDSEELGEAPNRTGSEGGPESWFNALIAIKNPADFGVLAVIPGGECQPFVPLPGFDDGLAGTAEIAKNIALFLGRIVTQGGQSGHVKTINICRTPAQIAEEIVEFRELADTVCNG